jgi:hypothetical protein
MSAPCPDASRYALVLAFDGFVQTPRWREKDSNRVALANESALAAVNGAVRRA